MIRRCFSTIGVLREIVSIDKRVIATPETVERYIKLGYTVNVESDAGKASNFSNDLYVKAGATIKTKNDLINNSEILMQINPPTTFPKNKILISSFAPNRNKEIIQTLKSNQIHAISLDCIPRTISRGQAFDVLSSQANIAGYRAVIEASHHFGKFFPGQMTAAGKLRQAQVLIIGTGVAGLSAIQTAKGLGANVFAFDVRKETKEQVESMGGKFLSIDTNESGSTNTGYAKEMSAEWKQRANEMLEKKCSDIDIIITTALIPGKPAPKMITRQMIERMKPGSVTVDLAAEMGGNIETTIKNQVVNVNGVTCIGYTDMVSRLPITSSTLYSNNVYNLISSYTVNGKLKIDDPDDILSHMLITHENYPPKAVPVVATPLPIQVPARHPTARKRRDHASWRNEGNSVV